MLYEVLNISKQAVHQHKVAVDRRMEELGYVEMIVEQVRSDHPTMGIRIRHWVRALGWEDLLEEEVATHSNILAWRIDRRDWRATVHRVAKSQT